MKAEKKKRPQSLSRVRLFATPQNIALQVPLFMGFSRQEYWSGLPCPPPGDLPNPGIKPRSPALQADSLPAEPQGKPKNTGAGSLSLLQGIFLTQKLNHGLLHCRRILYQLSFEGSNSENRGKLSELSRERRFERKSLKRVNNEQIRREKFDCYSL